MSLANALKWSFMAELASKAVQPVVFIVLARLLSPEDFGVMAAAFMVMAFSQVFWEAGMGQALIQRRNDVDAAANAAFWINIVLGVTVALVLLLAAGPLGKAVFHDERVAAVIQFMTLQVFLGAVCSVHTALLEKDMAFKRLFWVRLATVSVPGLASIPLAWNGMGYWALVAGVLVGQAAQVAMLWRMSGWRPRWDFDRTVAREMARFGIWVGASGLLAWFFLWADSLIVGVYLGSHDLGLYRTGNQFAAMVFAVMFGPISPVLYSHLARINGDGARLRAAAGKVVRTLTAVAIPVAVIVFFLSDQLAGVLFGPKWDGLGLVLGVMALMHGLSWVVGLNGEIYRAMGKPSRETIVTGALLLVYLVAYLYSVRFGLEPFVWTRLGLAVVALALHLVVLALLLKIAIAPLVAHLAVVSLVSLTCGYGVQMLLRNFWTSTWAGLLGAGIASFALIASILVFLERNSLVKDFKLMMTEGRSA